jgi:hypothetical protein
MKKSLILKKAIFKKKEVKNMKNNFFDRRTILDKKEDSSATLLIAAFSLLALSFLAAIAFHASKNSLKDFQIQKNQAEFLQIIEETHRIKL